MTKIVGDEVKMQNHENNEFRGLTQKEVAERVANGQINTPAKSPTKSIGQIIFNNIFTLFNGVNFAIFLLVFSTGRLSNTLFMGVIISNTLIGIVQEIRAKRTIDKLSVLSALHASVIRDGVKKKIEITEIVLDDVCVLGAGEQISADGIALQADEFEVDESLLTGEAEPVLKKVGDALLSGSFVVAGNGVVRITGVGNESYAQKLNAEAKKYKRAHSQILAVLNSIIKFVTIAIVPTGILLFLAQTYRSGSPWADAVVATSAGIIGMIPEGLIILTSIAFAAGMIKLALRKAVVQELAGIEVLAHVNMLCLDKTGTLTEGTLEVAEVQFLEETAESENTIEIANLLGALKDKNSTGIALEARFGTKNDLQVTRTIPFSSARKWSGAQFAQHGTFVVGSPEFVFKDSHQEFKAKANEFAIKGYRVLVFAKSNGGFDDTNTLPTGLEPVALILLLDMIRAEASDTLKFFAENDVEIKVISGDNPATVSEVARKLGLKGAEKYIDATTLPDEGEALAQAASNFTVFGRVTPIQKKHLILALKAQGNVVAMTGDGVNDVLALREADCSIAMASGSDAARGTSQVVLLDSNFATMPKIVMEGRQVINNIERVACLYLTKTIFSMLLSIFFIASGFAYPFFPVHLTIIGAVTIGIPSFFLALEPNYKRVEGNFLRKIIINAVPGGLTITLFIIATQFLAGYLQLEDPQLRTLSVLITATIGMMVLIRASLPLNTKRTVLILLMAALFIAVLLFLPFEISQISMPKFYTIKLFIFLAILAIPLYIGIRTLLAKLTKGK